MVSDGDNELTYSNILFGHSDGFLTMNHISLQWRSKSTEVIKKFNKSDLLKFSWVPTGSATAVLKLFITSGKVLRFHNFKIEDYTPLTKYCDTQYNLHVEKEQWTSTGGNWGTLKIMGESLALQEENENDNHKTVLEIPLDAVSQCAVPNKNEVELQFHEDDTVAGDEETLAEMRLYVPPNNSDESNDNSSSTTAADELKNEILLKANISTISGKSIVDLDESIGTFLTPRGRYAIEMYKKFLRMHGKTYDYKIMYTNINRCFLLERPDGVSSAFVISLEEPIRQGKQRYPHLVLQLKKTETQIDLNVTPEDLQTYDGLSERMSGLLPSVVATLFKYVVQKKVYTSGKFKTHTGERALKCALKAQEGLLYPLEKSFMFIHKPTNFIRYDEVTYVEFQRYSGQTGSSASRNFDLLVKCKGLHAGEASREFLFSAIDRREFPELSQFLTNKKLKVRNLKETTTSSSAVTDARVLRETLGPEEGEIDEESEDDDSDFGPGEEEEESSEESSSEDDSDNESEKEESARKKRKKNNDDDSEE